MSLEGLCGSRVQGVGQFALGWRWKKTPAWGWDQKLRDVIRIYLELEGETPVSRTDGKCGREQLWLCGSAALLSRGDRGLRVP